VYKQLFEEAIGESPPPAVDVDASLIRARRRARTRRRWAVGGVTVAVFALAAGVGVVLGEEPAPRVGDRPTAASSPPVAPSAIDWYDPRDLEFYRQFRWGDAIELARPPKDFRTAVELSTAVVLAHIVDVRYTRRIGEPPIEMSAFVLRPVEVISGRLRPELGGVVEVEFFGLPTDPAGLAAMRARLPMGPAVWFLRWQGEPAPSRKPGAPLVDPAAELTRYSTVHPTMVFVPGPDGVNSAFFLNQPSYTGRGAPREALRFSRLSELVADLRQR
jgi:hypothetical protein